MLSSMDDLSPAEQALLETLRDRNPHSVTDDNREIAKSLVAKELAWWCFGGYCIALVG